MSADFKWEQMHHGTCPICGVYGFIGHGPLCTECYLDAAEEAGTR